MHTKYNGKGNFWFQLPKRERRLLREAGYSHTTPAYERMAKHAAKRALRHMNKMLCLTAE